jgi:hypothetical protein
MWLRNFFSNCRRRGQDAARNPVDTSIAVNVSAGRGARRQVVRAGDNAARARVSGRSAGGPARHNADVPTGTARPARVVTTPQHAQTFESALLGDLRGRRGLDVDDLTSPMAVFGGLDQ